ncbi:MAG TPA: ArgE/DapE family deacylase [Terriglobia bacterium]|nr:ArgE/DapE family deacylase [Terriglobia bacterium]
MSESTINLLRDLIAIDSVNPSLVPGAAGEKQVAAAIAAKLGSGGMDVQIQQVAPGRSNVIGVLDSQQKGRSLMFCGHMDTVGVAGMDAPFDPAEKNGRIYGRGSQDMKGGLASMIAAALALSRNGGLPAGRLIVAAVIDEEYASIGAEALVTAWKTDAAVVGEPTDMKIAVGHKGFEWVEITTEGIAAHGSRPAEGRDAILRMGRVLSRLETLDRELQARQPHPVHGAASLHASFIAGGRELSTYPDQCTLQMERRTIDGEPNACGLTDAETILNDLRRDDPEFKASARFLFSRPPYLTPADHPLPGLIESALEQRGQKGIRGGMSFWTDAAVLGQAGIPSVVFGPGGAGLHSISEYVIADDVITCRDALTELAKEFCSGR